MPGTGKRLLAGIGVVSALVLPASAHAADYYASDSAVGGEACDQLDPCTLTEANDLAVNPGDSVLLYDGIYTLAAPLEVEFGVRMAPATPGTIPELTSAAGHGIVAYPGATLEQLEIDIAGLTGGLSAVELFGATGRRLHVTAEGGSSTGVYVSGPGLLEDSTARHLGTFSQAVWATRGTSGAVTVRNVTSYATGADSRGLFANAFSGPITVTVQNSIARGTAADIGAGFGASPVTMNVDHSNFVTTVDDPMNDVFINDLDGNQNLDPMLAHPGVPGDFHQTAASPTINAGAAVAGISSLDLDGEPRCMGTAPDIGADEFTDTPCGPPPSGGGPPTGTGTPPDTAPPKKRCKKGFKLKQVKTKKGKKKKKCVKVKRKKPKKR